MTTTPPYPRLPLLIFSLLLGFNASAAAVATPATATASPGAPGLGDRLFPLAGNGGIDVQHYDLTLSWDPDSNRIDATASLRIVATQALSAFNLDFHGLQLDAVQLDGIPVAYRRDGDELTITPAQAVPRNAGFRLLLRYHGVPTPIPGSVTEGWDRRGSAVAVMSEPVAAKGWFPNNNHPSDKATYSYRVTVPKPWSVAANGMPGETLEQGDRRTFSFATREPLASYLATVNIGEFELERSRGPNGVPILNYFFTGATAEDKKPFQRYPEMLAFFSERFGPYPFASAGNILHQAQFGIALETQTRAVFGSPTSENTVAHELVHQWFGNHVSLQSWDEIWLKEGFSRYGEWLWQEHLGGPEAMQQMVKYGFESLMGIQRMPKRGWVELEHFFEIAEARLNRAQLTRIIDLATAGHTDPVELQRALALVPAEGLSNRELDRVLAEISFDHFELTAGEFNELDALVAGKRYDPSTQFSFEQMVKLLGEAPEGVDSQDKMYSPGVYTRAALALHALRLKLGDAVFFRILRRWGAQFGGGSASYDDFKALATQQSGQQLSAFFADWMQADVVPDLPALGLYKADYQ